MKLTGRDRLAAILAGVFLLAMLISGPLLHPLEEIGSGEWDGYVDKAEQIRGGDLPRDGFHPLLYPALVAALTALVGDGFAAARLVSTLASLLFLVASFFLGRRALGRSGALFALIGLAVSLSVIRFGLHASTDMSFAALVTTSVYFSLRLLDRRDFANAAFLAAAMALAYGTRYLGVVILPVALLALILIGGITPFRKALIGLAALAVMLLVLLPHFMVTDAVFGTPLHNENWKNLAFKLFGQGQWSYLENPDAGGLLAVISSAPGAFLSTGLRELALLLAWRLPRLVAGAGLGHVIVLLAFLGLIRILRRPDKRLGLLLAFATLYALLVSFFFYSWDRLLLPLLPLVWLLAAHFLQVFAGRFNLRGCSCPAFVPPMALVIIAAVLTTALGLPGFARHHPVAERQAALRLVAEEGTGIRSMATAPYLGRGLGLEIAYSGDVSGEEVLDPALYFDRLRRELNGEGFLIVGRASLGDRPAELLDASAPPGWQRVFGDSLATVWRLGD